ncbi:MAG: sensor histidine kinase, partial [Oscillospiraceae bacterium]
IENIYFRRNDGKEFYEYSNSLNRKTSVLEAKWLRLAKAGDMELKWTETRDSDVFLSTENAKVFSMVKEVNTMMFESRGVLLMDIKESFLKNSLSDINLGGEGCAFVIDKNKNIISTATSENFKDEYYAKAIEEICKNENGVDDLEINLDGMKYLVNYNTIDINGWRLVAIFPKSTLTKQADVMRSMVLYIALLSIFVFVSISIIVVLFVTAPIGKFVNVMNKVKDGDMTIRFKPDKDDEIGMLGNTFNNMIENINVLMVEVEQERNMKVVAELKSLYQQINSHFLYNTLDSIYWLCKGGDGENAANMLSALANFMRLGLNNGEEITTISKELQHVENYMVIQKYRYDDLSCEIKVDDEIMECLIPKLILQPLVENSIIHGINENGNKSGGNIIITGKRVGDSIVLSVSDDGTGMDTETVYALMKDGGKSETKGGYALHNVYNRLKMNHKYEGTVELYSDNKNGSTVTITLPFDYKK